MTTGLVHVVGEVTTDYVEIPQIVRDEVRRIGYTSSAIGFDGSSCGVSVSIGQQSADISAGVSKSLEGRTGAGVFDELDIQGAGDQGLMFGYACDDTPPAHAAADLPRAPGLAERLALVRKEGLVAGLRGGAGRCRPPGVPTRGPAIHREAVGSVDRDGTRHAVPHHLGVLGVRDPKL
ncbi:S-adenosylmethionine synthetase N-terminal domain-containing protein [Georgenia sp. SUBG003]|uniref:S-adenosylmethionine synthetase N-terminal domain-containing protein n=1 Tax=Georgenia sp. SUBG003 TaxID=1497974 RepID=UPI003AB4C1AF